jgi:hypothetical protein
MVFRVTKFFLIIIKNQDVGASRRNRRTAKLVLCSAHGFFSFVYSVFLSLLCRRSRAAIQQVHGYPTATAATQRRTLGNLFAFGARTQLTVYLQVASAAVARIGCSQGRLQPVPANFSVKSLHAVSVRENIMLVNSSRLALASALLRLSIFPQSLVRWIPQPVRCSGSHPIEIRFSLTSNPGNEK